MGLENLKSIFTVGIEEARTSYQSNQPEDSNNSRLLNSPPQPTDFIATDPTDFSSAGIGFSNYIPKTIPFLQPPTTVHDLDGNLAMLNPILDSFARLPSEFVGGTAGWVNEGTGLPRFRMEMFDPRVPKNEGITITQNAYVGTQYIPTNPTDFSSAGIGEGVYTPFTTPPKAPPESSFSPSAESPFQTTDIDMYANDITVGGSPILDSFSRLPSEFVGATAGWNNQGIGLPRFRLQDFDPRIPKNSGISITPNGYLGTQYIPSNPTDFSSAGIDNQPYTQTAPLTDWPNTNYSSNTSSPFITTTLNTSIAGNNLGLGQTPLLDQFARSDTAFIVDTSITDYSTHPYRTDTFDPRSTNAKPGTTYDNTNSYVGTMYEDGLDTNNQNLAGDNYMTSLGRGLEESGGWSALYNNDHTPILDVSSNPNAKFQPYTGYGPNVNKDRLDIKGPQNNEDLTGTATGGGVMFGYSRRSLLKTQSIFGDGPDEELAKARTAKEPYIVSKIPEEDGKTGGRKQNKGWREIPLNRALEDTLRISKFLASNAGVAWMVKQNLPSVIPNTVVKAEIDGKDKLVRVPQRYNKFHSPLSTLGATALRGAGIGLPHVLINKDWPVGALIPKYSEQIQEGRTIFKTKKTAYILNSVEGSLPFRLDNTFNNAEAESTIGFQSKDWLGRSVQKSMPGGDSKTLASMISGKIIESGKIKGDKIKSHTITTGKRTIQVSAQKAEASIGASEKEKDGMPFYFKDLRDDTYIFFRAYLEGLAENVTPSWNPVNYVGRSQPAYVYGGQTERDVNFTLKVMAQTRQELDMIYMKINRLTSMCYPQYREDRVMTVTGASQTSNLRMKPPLAKLRMGELWGSRNNEMTGYIESIAYTVPEETTWETEPGYRVPKYLFITVAFRVIDKFVPQLKNPKNSDNDYTYYGINNTLINGGNT